MREFSERSRHFRDLILTAFSACRICAHFLRTRRKIHSLHVTLVANNDIPARAPIGEHENITKKVREKMQVGSKMATVAVVLVGLTLVGASAASAYQESDVSIAYADGYMGTDGQFHVWEHRADAEQFRAKHLDQYRAWRHDDPRHQGDH
jgi:hypothetical protein